LPKLKLTKTAVDAAQPTAEPYELRDTMIPGFLLKVTPAGRKVFMLAYVANNGQRRKPAIGQFGEITVEQAREIAQDWLASVRKGKDPSLERRDARRAPTVKELFDRFITDYSEHQNKPSTVKANRSIGKLYIIPHLGNLKAPDVRRPDIANLMTKISHSPGAANRAFSVVRKMFNMAEVWGIRPDGTNPCRHIPKFPEHAKTRLITDAEMRLLFAYLNKAEAEGLEHPFLILAVRLQFEFAGRMSEILLLEWAWVDLEKRRIEWPDSKTGGMSKPINAQAADLLANAPRLDDSPYVCPSVFDPQLPMSKHTYYGGWARILERAGLAHVGTHGIRHRSATDIANSGIPVKVGMALTAHKTVTQFMRYVHTEDDQVRMAADAVASRRVAIVTGAAKASKADAAADTPPEGDAEPEILPGIEARLPPPGLEDGKYNSRTKLGNYRPFRHRTGQNREIPPGTKHAATAGKQVSDVA
jgi:integrase